ncbi:MAG: 2-hydroxyacid dehydrogenase [Massiliimalia sp.]
MKIVLLESLGISPELLEQYAAPLRQAGHCFEAYERNTDPHVQIQRCQDADVLILANMPLSGQVISACSKLKFIDIAFTGVDHVDLAAAKEKQIQVSNAAGYSTQAVAELALGMMISLLRNIPQVETRCRQGQTKDGLVGSELGGKTVGIVGVGAIGQRTAELCRAFGCRVLGYQRHNFTHPFIESTDLHTLLSQSDIVSLHCPLNEDSRNLIDEKAISLMKDGAILINTARGPVVDSHALADSLNRGKLSGAGIDVFETEPPLNTDHPLLHAKNTLVTPHVAFASQESMKARAQIVFDNLTQWMNGNQINRIL